MLRFQLTPPHGGRHAGVFLRLADRSFNSRPRMGGDGSPESPCPSCTCFNSRPRMGGDGRPCGSACGPPVSTHAPAWGATFSALQSSFTGWFQLTPPHGGRPFQLLVGEVAAVSTHAPAWGATSSAASSSSTTTFQLTPPHGGRPGRPPSGPRGPRFNSRPRMGGDMHRRKLLRPCRRFNSRPRMGGDAERIRVEKLSSCFNSRPRMGGDRNPSRPHSPRRCFNSRPRMGGDHPVEKVPLRHAVSTHAPAWGATRARRTSSSGASRFNSRPRMGGDWATSTASTPRPVSTHAPAWGATLPSGDGDHDVLVSTHAPAWGATDEFTAKAPGQRFQLTPPHGGRRRSPPLHLRASCFNSRPRMGGDSMNEAINELLLFQLTPPHGGRPA